MALLDQVAVIACMATCGVKVCRLADVEPEILDLPRLKYELGTG